MLPSLFSILRAVVAILLGIEAAVLLYAGMTWPVPYPIIAAVIFALLYQNLWRPIQVTAAIVTAICAILFVFPGSIMMVAGACGIVNSTCSADETFWGITGFAVATLVNFAAVALLIWRPQNSTKARSG